MGISAGVAAVSSLASIGLSAYGTVEKGKGVQAANEMQAAQAERSAQLGRVQADLTDATMTERQTSVIGNIEAARAAGGVDAASPTTSVIEDWNRAIAGRQRLAAVGSEREQAATEDASARYLRQAGDFAVRQSYLGAGTSVFSGLAQGFGPKGSFSLAA